MKKKKRTKVTGVPFAWAETGTEGFVWAVQDYKHISEDGKSYEYEGLNCIRQFDTLELWRIKDNKGKCLKKKKKIWSGEVRVLKWSHQTDEEECLTLGGGIVHWLPDSVDLWQWAEIFMNESRKGEFEAVLTRETDEASL